ncbi:MAG: thiol peroxidase [Desulfobacteraceae bacterium]|nr:MAG: thiol peroxidase [Desulfobacteraceae bacterium]
MKETLNSVTLHGNPLTLVGSTLKIGDKAPDFEVMDNELKPKTLADFSGKVVIVSSVPSLDTPVCDMETRRFNTEASRLGDGIRILTISMDLPFAQKRWCGAAGVDQVVTLSDHRQASFGQAFGVLIKELRLLARAVFVVDADLVIRHIQLVREVAEEPDYDAVIAAAKHLV